MTSPKTLLITGVSSGFGRALAEEALAAGHRVVGTVRAEPARIAFESLSPGAAIGRILDVTDVDAIDGVVADIEWCRSWSRRMREIGAAGQQTKVP